MYYMSCVHRGQQRGSLRSLLGTKLLNLCAITPALVFDCSNRDRLDRAHSVLVAVYCTAVHLWSWVL